MLLNSIIQVKYRTDVWRVEEVKCSRLRQSGKETVTITLKTTLNVVGALELGAQRVTQAIRRKINPIIADNANLDSEDHGGI